MQFLFLQCRGKDYKALGMRSCSCFGPTDLSGGFQEQWLLHGVRFRQQRIAGSDCFSSGGVVLYPLTALFDDPVLSRLVLAKNVMWPEADCERRVASETKSTSTTAILFCCLIMNDR